MDPQELKLAIAKDITIIKHLDPDIIPGSILATYFFVRMELNRIGVSTLFAAINKFFQKGKPFHTPLK